MWRLSRIDHHTLHLYFFFFKGYGPPRDLHSFPTRRSSDLPRPKVSPSLGRLGGGVRGRGIGGLRVMTSRGGTRAPAGAAAHAASLALSGPAGERQRCRM